MFKQHWYVTVCAYLSLLSYGLTITAIGPALDIIRDDYEVSSGDVGLLFTLLALGLILGVVFAGHFVNRYSLKTVSILSQLLLSAGLIAFAFSNCLPIGITAYFVIGLSGGFIEIATNTTVSTIYTGSRVSALNVLHTFFGIGALAGPAISGGIIQVGWDWGMIYIIISICSLAVFGLYLFSRFPGKVEQRSMNLALAVNVMKSRYVILLCVAILMYSGVEMGINGWSVMHLEENLTLKTIIASSILSYFWIALTFGRIICAYLSRRFPPQHLLLGLSLGAVCAYGIFVITSNAVVAGIALTFVGLFFSGMFPIIIGLGANRFPDMIGTSMSILMLANGIGLMILPWVVGTMADHFSLEWGMRSLWFVILALTLTTGVILRRTGPDK